MYTLLILFTIASLEKEKKIWFELILRFSARHSKALTLKPLFIHTTFTPVLLKYMESRSSTKKKELRSSNFYLVPKVFSNSGSFMMYM